MSFTRRLRIFALTAAMALTAAGCGFQPIHGERSIASGAALATVDIGLIADRTGQMLRNQLMQQMHPRGATVPARFALAVTLNESLQDLAIRKDETATRANLILTAAFVMTENSSGAVVFRGVERSVTSYNILSNEFATLSAERDARSRGAEQLADHITTRVALYFNRTKRPVAGK